MRKRRIPAVAVVAVALVAALVLVELLTSGGSSEPRGRAAPTLPREVLTPPRATLASLRGHPVLVNFWASWCGPCQREARHLSALSHRLRGGAVLVGVDWNDGLSGARAFIRQYGWTFPNLRDASGTVGNEFGLSGLPNTFVLDRHGRIKKVLIGPQTVASFERALRSVE
jgi:cytochrome c biogenesis protein CcmG, thiol:disulfide interchange protein DsbE